jgi:hypothetical protein
MTRRLTEDSWHALNSVTDAAERFVNHSPRLKRLEAERQVLLDAIRRAQLLLSVKRLPNSAEFGSPAPSLARARARRQRQRARSTRAT